MVKRTKSRRKARQEHPLAFTIQGEFVSESPDPKSRDAVAHPGRRGEESALKTELRLFGSATRVGFNRVREGEARADAAARSQKRFCLNCRALDDASLKAEEHIESQKALVPPEFEATRVKLGTTQKQLAARREKERMPREGNGVLSLGVPEPAHARSPRRDDLIGALRMRVDAATTSGKPPAGEDVAFTKEHGARRAVDRMSANLPCAKILEALAGRRKEGEGLPPANPAYTFSTGRICARREGVGAHQAATRVIGRSVLGHGERFDPDRRRRLVALREKLVEEARRRRAPLAGERPRRYGVARRLGASPAQERLRRCDGHPPWRRTRASPRGALVELRRYRWAEAAVSGTC